MKDSKHVTALLVLVILVSIIIGITYLFTQHTSPNDSPPAAVVSSPHPLGMSEDTRRMFETLAKLEASSTIPKTTDAEMKKRLADLAKNSAPIIKK